MSVDEAFRRLLERPEAFARRRRRPEDAPPPDTAARPARAASTGEATIDLDAVTRVDYFDYPPIEEHTAVAREYRDLRMRLQGLKLDRPSLLFTSAQRGEGVTCTAAYLALTMARRREKRILLADVNLRRPGVAKLLRVAAEYDIADAVQDRCPPEAAMRYTEEDNLYVLLARRRQEDPAEVLESEAFGALLGRLTASFDLVILDAPPCLAVSDPVVIGAHCGGAILVARAHETPRERTAQAARVLEENGVPLQGMVLTFVKDFVPALFQEGA